jgi:predicted hydrocarbon binding protein
MEGWVGADRVRREGRLVRVTFGPCACPMVADVTEPLSPTYCHCSVGWLKEMFETVSGKPVTVETHETVKRGGKACRFTVRLEA